MRRKNRARFAPFMPVSPEENDMFYRMVVIISAATFAIAAFAANTVPAEPYWVFFSGGPGRRAGDTVDSAAIRRVAATGASVVK